MDSTWQCAAAIVATTCGSPAYHGEMSALRGPDVGSRPGSRHAVAEGGCGVRLHTQTRAILLRRAVTQLQHALQCARQAELAEADPVQVVAALLHDLGHFLVDEQDEQADSSPRICSTRRSAPTTCNPTSSSGSPSRFGCTCLPSATCAPPMPPTTTACPAPRNAASSSRAGRCRPPSRRSSSARNTLPLHQPGIDTLGSRMSVKSPSKPMSASSARWG